MARDLDEGAEQLLRDLVREIKALRVSYGPHSSIRRTLLLMVHDARPDLCSRAEALR